MFSPKIQNDYSICNYIITAIEFVNLTPLLSINQLILPSKTCSLLHTLLLNISHSYFHAISLTRTKTLTLYLTIPLILTITRTQILSITWSNPSLSLILHLTPSPLTLALLFTLTCVLASSSPDIRHCTWPSPW